MGEVDAQLSAHDFVIVQIPHRGCSGVCVVEFGKAKTFGSAGIVVVHEAEVEDLAYGTEDVHNLGSFSGTSLL